MEPLEIHEHHDLTLNIFCEKNTEIVIKQGDYDVKIYKLLAGDNVKLTIN